MASTWPCARVNHKVAAAFKSRRSPSIILFSFAFLSCTTRLKSFLFVAIVSLFFCKFSSIARQRALIEPADGGLDPAQEYRPDGGVDEHALTGRLCACLNSSTEIVN